MFCTHNQREKYLAESKLLKKKQLSNWKAGTKKPMPILVTIYKNACSYIIHKILYTQAIKQAFPLQISDKTSSHLNIQQPLWKAKHNKHAKIVLSGVKQL